MRMAVIGSGYVGTVTGTCLADMGHTVICTDLDTGKIDLLQQGQVPFFEKGLDAKIKTNVEEKRLSFTSDIQGALKDADVIFLCMGAKNAPVGKPDMRPLTMAVDDIAKALVPDRYTLIVEKSTLPIKSGEFLQELLDEALPKDKTYQFDIAAVPQFMREGNAIHDFFHPDRVVIGADSQDAIDILVKLYQPLNGPMLITDLSSAELIKHATNAFLAMKISFINSIAHVCEKTNADITMVAKGLGMDRRISPHYLNAGIGYGGIFFPKDINSLVAIADEYHLNLDLLKTTEIINRYQRINFIERVERAVGGDLHGKTVAVWGLAFRPGTDDMRDCPSSHIIRGFIQRGAKVQAYDPIAMEKNRTLFPKITYCDDMYAAAKGADAIAIVTEWPEFIHVDMQKLKADSDCRVIVDGRNLYPPKKMEEHGYHYVSIGRAASGQLPQ